MVPPKRSSWPHTRPSVIAAFNEAYDIVAMLETHGYTRAGKRWKSSYAKHSSAPGMVLLPSGRIYCHDSDDPLGDEKAHDAFDVFVQLEHGGDIRAATRAAARILEINQ